MSRPRALLFRLCCLLVLASVQTAVAQDATALLDAKPKEPEAIALGDIPARADADERHVEEVVLRAGQANPLGRLLPRLTAIEQSVDGKNRMFRYGELRTLPVAQLESLERHWKFDQRQYARWRADMQATVAPYTDDAAELSRRRAEWELTRKAMPPDSMPAALSQRIDGMIAQIQRAEQALSAPLLKQISLGRRANALDARIRTGQKAVSDAITYIDQRLLRLDAPPLWAVTSTSQVQQGVVDSLGKGIKLENRFLAQYAAADLGNQRLLHMVQVLLLPLLLVLAWRHRRHPRRVDAEAPASTAGEAPEDPALRVLRRPVSTWLLLSMIGVLVFEPNAPLFLHQLAMLVALVPVLRLLPASGRRLLGPWPYAATGFYLLQRLGVLLVANATLYRGYYVLLAVLGLGATLWLLWASRGRSYAGLTGRSGRAVHALAWVGVIVLGAALVSNVVGNVTLAEMLVNAIIESGYLALVLYAAVTVFTALLRWLFARKEIAHLRLVRTHGTPLLDLLLKLLTLAAVIGWAVYTMNRFRIFRPAYDVAKSVLAHRFEYGELSLSLGHVLVFFVGVFVAFWAAKTVRALLKDELLPRMSLPRGVDNSIASLSYYALLLLGLLAALSAAGFKIGQLAFVFGALGVGIGLGLQSVVNNFVSGLILMFERPVQPGDVVDVSGTSGRVRNIGMRATTLRTAEGAYVVVPNGMLLSEKLTNWTLMDRNRRLDVNLGVAYGSDVPQVLQLLMQVTRDTPDVATQPEPVVLFTGFGPSSLDFAIRAWTHNFDDSATVRSQLLTRLHEAFRSAGIALPFPQQDVHLRSVPEALLGLAPSARNRETGPPGDTE